MVVALGARAHMDHYPVLGRVADCVMGEELEGVMMNDLISRHDAIEAVEELIAIHFDRVVILNKVVVALLNIPSAEVSENENAQY